MSSTDPLPLERRMIPQRYFYEAVADGLAIGATPLLIDPFINYTLSRGIIEGVQQITNSQSIEEYQQIFENLSTRSGGIETFLTGFILGFPLFVMPFFTMGALKGVYDTIQCLRGKKPRTIEMKKGTSVIHRWYRQALYISQYRDRNLSRQEAEYCATRQTTMEVIAQKTDDWEGEKIARALDLLVEEEIGQFPFDHPAYGPASYKRLNTPEKCRIEIAENLADYVAHPNKVTFKDRAAITGDFAGAAVFVMGGGLGYVVYDHTKSVLKAIGAALATSLIAQPTIVLGLSALYKKQIRERKEYLKQLFERYKEKRKRLAAVDALSP